MRPLNASLTLILFLFTLNVASASKLAIILLDGFRCDYISRRSSAPSALPALSGLAAAGARAEYVQPIFPSSSFPSWTTIVTGLPAEGHGIVGNYIYDPETAPKPQNPKTPKPLLTEHQLFIIH